MTRAVSAGILSQPSLTRPGSSGHLGERALEERGAGPAWGGGLMRTQSLCVHLSRAGCGLLPGGGSGPVLPPPHLDFAHCVPPHLLPTLPLLSFTPCPHLGPGTELLRRACPGGMRTGMDQCEAADTHLALVWCCPPSCLCRAGADHPARGWRLKLGRCAGVGRPGFSQSPSRAFPGRNPCCGGSWAQPERRGNTSGCTPHTCPSRPGPLA